MERVSRYLQKLLLSSSWIRHGLYWMLTLLIQSVATLRLLETVATNQIEYLFGNLLIQMVFAYAAYSIYKIAFRLNSLLLFIVAIPVLSYPNAIALHWWQLHIYPHSPLADETMYFYPASLMLQLFFVTLKFAKDLYVWQQEEFARKQEQAESELNFLKAQISPHFLFNTLNNLYGHAVTKSDLLPDMMLRLSDLLRYTIYETSKPLVPLHDELDYIRNYIALEKMRLSDKSHVKFDLPDNVDMSLQIAPLLLISFVENAFKHSRHSLSNMLYINGTVKIEGKRLILQIENSYNPEIKKENVIKRDGGIGMDNVSKRLKLLYENKHRLTNERTDSIYKLKLQLDL